MNEKKRQYSSRTEYESIPKHESKSLDCLLPEWIINLKNYFEKKPDNNYSPAYKSIYAACEYISLLSYKSCQLMLSGS